ncbi:hypothetical protein ACWGIB_10805 [Streptomyces xiamenensis]
MTERLPSEPNERARAMEASVAAAPQRLRPSLISWADIAPRGHFRLGDLLSADDVMRYLVIEAKDIARRSRPRSREYAGRIVLRTAEKGSGIPCSVSGLLYGLSPTPRPPIELLIDGQHRLSVVEAEVRHAAGSGKTAIAVARLFKTLTQRMGRLNRNGHVPTADDLVRIADEAQALSRLLLDLVQNLLTGCVKVFKHLIAVPPNESSPCGVLRLAVRRVPRAPGVGGAGRFISPIGFALAR